MQFEFCKLCVIIQELERVLELRLVIVIVIVIVIVSPSGETRLRQGFDSSPSPSPSSSSSRLVERQGGLCLISGKGVFCVGNFIFSSTAISIIHTEGRGGSYDLEELTLM